jgi:potassium-transporting ATPase potassium-binding subunit
MRNWLVLPSIKNNMFGVARITKRNLRPALIVFILLLLVTGIVYPFLVTGVAQVVFPHQANGSIIEQNGTVIGSELIGQPFNDSKYFWGRLSTTPGFPYNASLSSGSNLGPSNGQIRVHAEERINALKLVDPNNNQSIPSDLVTSSASGLDPHISVASAHYQASRIAHERNRPLDEINTLIDTYTEDRNLGFIGEKTVNVLKLNLALDAGERPVNSSINANQDNPRFLGLTGYDWLFLAFFFALFFLLVGPVGRLLYSAFTDERHIFSGFSDRYGALVMKRSKSESEMDWKEYVIAVLIFGFIGFLFLFSWLILQGYTPLNPEQLPSLSIDLAFNTAVSFVTNTNWQAYAGEVTMSPLTQMIGMTVQNFLSAAVGIAVLMVLIRGISRRSTKKLGNFWKDVTKATLILLPICFVLALIYVSQGVPQTLNTSVEVHLLQPTVDAIGNSISTQKIPIGPVASQMAIKHLGTNGGGFFNANSAHPFENPNGITCLITILAFLIIPGGLCYTFGKMVKDRRQGIALLLAMSLIFIVCLGIVISAEEAGNPQLNHLQVNQLATEDMPGGNMEGKELRFGCIPSCLHAVGTTATSCGSVNSMHDSYTPLGGMSLLLLMQFGEVVFGGVGSGLYGMLVFVIIANFIAGLMIGRMPEYLGKKIDARIMRLSTIIIIIPIVTILAGISLAVLTPEGRSSVLNLGPHGFSEILYAFTSAAQNNGSAFAGLMANTMFYNVALGIAMLIGRYLIIILTLALAGAMIEKKINPPSSGTLPTHTVLFIVWLIAVIVLVGALSFISALALGPLVEHLLLPI